jgi:hypothetical protein
VGGDGAGDDELAAIARDPEGPGSRGRLPNTGRISPDASAGTPAGWPPRTVATTRSRPRSRRSWRTATCSIGSATEREVTAGLRSTAPAALTRAVAGCEASVQGQQGDRARHGLVQTLVRAGNTAALRAAYEGLIIAQREAGRPDADDVTLLEAGAERAAPFVTALMTGRPRARPAGHGLAHL